MRVNACEAPEETVNDLQQTVKGRGCHPASRGNLRPRVKGQPSLNPSGRPRKVFELAHQAQQHAGVALATLIEVMQDKRAPAAARISAASALLTAPSAARLNR